MDSNINRIERRRRYRNWVLAFQVGMVAFFLDQILKVWSATVLTHEARIRLFGGDSLALIHRFNPETWETWRLFLPAVIVALLALINWQRVHRAWLRDVLPMFSIAGSALSIQITLLWYGRPLHSLQWTVRSHVFEFALADAVLWVAVAIWILTLVWEIFSRADRKWVLKSSST